MLSIFKSKSSRIFTSSNLQVITIYAPKKHGRASEVQLLYVFLLSREKHITAISLYHVMHMWFLSHSVHAVRTLLCLHFVLTDVCCAPHVNTIGIAQNP